jgi:glucokinase
MDTLLKEGEFIVGLDIGGTKIMAVVLDHQFNVLGRCRKRSRSDKPARAGEKVEERVVRVIRSALQEAGDVPIKGIGVGSPGPLDPNTGVIIDTPNLAWKNFPLAQFLTDAFGVPAVVDNDVNMGTYGEWKFGAAADCRNVVGIFPGTGIGGGIVIEGKMYRGFTGAAGEVGHITIEQDGPYCGCGKRGCLEALASRIAISSQVAALAARGDAPTIFAECGTDLSKVRSGMLVKAIENGDRMVEGVVRKAAYYVGVAVSNMVNILSPEAVVLGGGLVEALTDIYLEEVGHAMQDHAMPFLREGVRLVPAALGDDAVALGAAVLISEHLVTLSD